jgi:copper chaperone CopZ
MDCCANKDKKDYTPETPDTAGKPGARSERFTLGGSVVAAVLSSACCWLPLLLLAFGASAAGVSAFFERWRPVFLIVAVALLGAGFYVVYFRKAACVDGACEAAPRSRRVFSQAMLWVAALLVGAFAMFPNYAGAFARTLYGSRSAGDSAAAVTGAALHRFSVEGMTCEACATTLQADLERIDGVASARVDYATKTAEVRSDAAGVGSLVQAAAERHGYRATSR